MYARASTKFRKLTAVGCLRPGLVETALLVYCTSMSESREHCKRVILKRSCTNSFRRIFFFIYKKFNKYYKQMKTYKNINIRTENLKI